MPLKSTVTTPWVRRHLAADPDMALAVESLRQTTPIDGRLGLFGKSPNGPWSALVNAPGAPLPGWKGTGPTVLAALTDALALAEAAA